MTQPRESYTPADLSSWTRHPHRIAVDAMGYVWRAYDDGNWSMAPTNPDNSPIPQPVTYYVPEQPGRDAETFIGEHMPDCGDKDD